MCRRVNCTHCGRPTYAGCGAHVEQVLADVLASERCRCRETPAQAPELRPRDTQPTVRVK
jgi:hypothetical protein